MKCKQCGREIPEAAIFCCWCGVKQLRERRKKDAIKVPKPRQLRSGAWNIELRAEGQSITEATAELCEAKARAIRAGFIAAKKAAPKMTVDAALEAYIKSRELLSPSTLRGYEATRFVICISAEKQRENYTVRKSVRKIKRFALHIRASRHPAAARSGTFQSLGA